MAGLLRVISSNRFSRLSNAVTLSPVASAKLAAHIKTTGNTQPATPVRMISLGLSAYDMVWSVDTLPAPGGKTRAESFHETGGGMAANAAVAAARLGAAVQFWGRAGNDRAGGAMVDALAAEGVNVARFRRFENAASSVSGITVDAHGERSIINFRGSALPTDPGWLPLEEVANTHVVLTDPRWPQGANAVLDAARLATVPTVLDGDVADSVVFNQLLPSVDYAVFSQPGLAGYASTAGASELTSQLEFARSRGCTTPAVTLGSQGVRWLDDRGLQQLPAFDVNVVDTTGAGDAFHGAASFAIAAGLSLRDAFIFASAVAAIKCTFAGGRAGIPNLATTLQFLHSLSDTDD